MPPCQLLGRLLLLPLLWLVLWLGSTDQHGLPGGVLFSLTTLFTTSILSGKLVQLCGVPPLLGMLLVGRGNKRRNSLLKRERRMSNSSIHLNLTNDNTNNNDDDDGTTLNAKTDFLQKTRLRTDSTRMKSVVSSELFTILLITLLHIINI